MKVEIATVAADLPARRWDQLAGGSVYGGHGWLRYQETDPDSEAVYVVVADDDGDWLAATPVYVVHQESNPAYRPPEPSDDARPTILVGNRRGYRNDLLLTDAPHRSRALEALVDAVHDVAAGHGVDVAWWLYLDQDTVEHLVPHSRQAVPHLLDGDCAIDLPGAGFEDYLAGASAAVRKRVRRDRAVFGRAGYRVEDLALADCWREVARLVTNLQRRHGHASTVEDVERLLHLQAETMGAAARVDACFLDDAMAGANVRFGTSGDLVSRACGFDYEILRDACEYFELTYYRAIEAAYRSASPHVGLGIGTYETKIRRGALVDLRWAVATGAAVVGLDADRVRARNHRELQRMSRTGLRESALRQVPPDAWVPVAHADDQELDTTGQTGP